MRLLKDKGFKVYKINEIFTYKTSRFIEIVLIQGITFLNDKHDYILVNNKHWLTGKGTRLSLNNLLK